MQLLDEIRPCKELSSTCGCIHDAAPYSSKQDLWDKTRIEAGISTKSESIGYKRYKRSPSNVNTTSRKRLIQLTKGIEQDAYSSLRGWNFSA